MALARGELGRVAAAPDARALRRAARQWEEGDGRVAASGQGGLRTPEYGMWLPEGSGALRRRPY